MHVFASCRCMGRMAETFPPAFLLALAFYISLCCVVYHFLLLVSPWFRSKQAGAVRVAAVLRAASCVHAVSAVFSVMRVMASRGFPDIVGYADFPPLTVAVAQSAAWYCCFLLAACARARPVPVAEVLEAAWLVMILTVPFTMTCFRLLPGILLLGNVATPFRDVLWFCQVTRRRRSIGYVVSSILYWLSLTTATLPVTAYAVYTLAWAWYPFLQPRGVGLIAIIAVSAILLARAIWIWLEAARDFSAAVSMLRLMSASKQQQRARQRAKQATKPKQE